MFSFLSTNSIFWISLFKLDSYGAVFRLATSSFPSFIRTRIENPMSYLYSKIDANNILNLTPLEYYFVFFFMFVHETKSQSRKVYNEQNDCIELDSVYGDLLIDYLNYFLPINKNNLDFPTSKQSSLNISFQNNSSPSSSSIPSIYPYKSSQSPEYQMHKHNYSEYPCLFKRSLKKSSIAQFENDLANLKDSNKSECNTSLERTNDIKKIDPFLRLINEIYNIQSTKLAI